ncbi:hypothetical protein T4B_12143 [Trichinella pseudospiralis]|uniref:Uncharacterized protein n=2 Tax=Trichinella pseudospiralis TaxID=6337 RepID=A0A0V1F771_TRIPS|nr:hypothetical protein T4A_5805 [Trichinella pseudospiralis]KRY81851.1 hypothetical protein T4D_15316 [Trichinella pseudospiralis]KRY81862.1 hypothetical protein T4D_1921 [Trichinella pseudospiralis]KRZ14958.1 hypothetical protein T4B_12143 [Trichinella pseudospiralis]KRZ26663.1 hypothetical protein T4C_4130 [Trichinella pseudospiralis]
MGCVPLNFEESLFVVIGDLLAAFQLSEGDCRAWLIVSQISERRFMLQQQIWQRSLLRFDSGQGPLSRNRMLS